jgi:thymidylate kinase
MASGMPINKIIALPGNQLAVKYAPDVLILTHIDVDMSIERTIKRNEESKGVFQEREFLQKVSDRFHSEWFSALMKENGTAVHCINTNQEITKVKQAINSLLSTHLI